MHTEFLRGCIALLPDDQEERRAQERKLLDAAERGQDDIVRDLIAQGIDVNCREAPWGIPRLLTYEGRDISIGRFLQRFAWDNRYPPKLGRTPLHCAANRGHATTIAFLIDHGAEVQIWADGIWATPLHTAAKFAHPEAVRTLLDNGADPNAPDLNGVLGTPIHSAVSSVQSDPDVDRFQAKRREIVSLLLEHGADVDVEAGPCFGPLNWRAGTQDLRITKLLIDHGADIHHPVMGSTLLHQAARSGNTALADLLIGLGSNLNARESAWGMTPLLLALKEGQEAMASLLIKVGADPRVPDHHGRTALDHTESHEMELLITKALESNPTSTSSCQHPLHEAAAAGRLDIVESLLADRASVDQRTCDGETPLHLAVKRGQFDSAETLLRNGANVNALAIDGQTPLHYAAAVGNTGMMGLLIQNRADVNRQDCEYETPLYLSVEHLHPEAVAFLLDHDAKADLGDLSQGMSPLHLAARSGSLEMVQSILAHGVPADLRSRHHSLTPLHYASYAGRMDVVRYLVAQGADVLARDGNGGTPLQYAVDGQQLRVTQFLLRHGASATAGDKRGIAPIHVAVFRGQPEMIKLLADHPRGLLGLILRDGIVNAVDKEGHTPLDYIASWKPRPKAKKEALMLRTELISTLRWRGAIRGPTPGRPAALMVDMAR